MKRHPNHAKKEGETVDEGMLELDSTTNSESTRCASGKILQLSPGEDARVETETETPEVEGVLPQSSRDSQQAAQVRRERGRVASKKHREKMAACRRADARRILFLEEEIVQLRKQLKEKDKVLLEVVRLLLRRLEVKLLETGIVEKGLGEALDRLADQMSDGGKIVESSFDWGEIQNLLD